MNILDYFDHGKEAVEPIVRAMNQRRSEAIAQQLMANGQPELAGDPMTRHAVMQSMVLEDAMAARKSRAIRDELLNAQVQQTRAGKPLELEMREAQLDAIRARAEALRTPKPAGGARALSPESAANLKSLADWRNNAPALAAQKAADALHKQSMLKFEMQKSAAEKDAAKLEDALAGEAKVKTGVPLDALLGATRMWRGDEAGTGTDPKVASHVHIETPKGRGSIKVKDFDLFFSRIDELRAKQKRLAEMVEPEKPVLPAKPAAAAATVTATEADQALAWATEHPDDPRAAAILEHLRGAGR